MGYNTQILAMDLKELNKAIDFLDSLPADKNPVIMDIPNIQTKHSCGTPACFGGYLYHYFMKPDVQVGNKISAYLHEWYSFSEGADKFANILGFKHTRELQEFLFDNPKLWGNAYGGELFGYNSAFGVHDIDSISLEDIVLHLRGFYDRVQAEQTRIKEEIPTLPKGSKPIGEM